MPWHHKLGNDRWIVEITNGKRGGYFVEAGALDGIIDSATYTLETEYGWTGICVEPGQMMYQLLINNRKCSCDNRCLADRPGVVGFIEARNENCGYSGMTTDLSEAKREHWATGVRRKAPAITLTELLQLHNAPHRIDYLALDTEGSEFRILRDFNFDLYQIGAISVEDGCCTELLLSKGYRAVLNPYCPVEYEFYFIRKHA